MLPGPSAEAGPPPNSPGVPGQWRGQPAGQYCAGGTSCLPFPCPTPTVQVATHPRSPPPAELRPQATCATAPCRHSGRRLQQHPPWRSPQTPGPWPAGWATLQRRDESWSVSGTLEVQLPGGQDSSPHSPCRGLRKAQPLLPHLSEGQGQQHPLPTGPIQTAFPGRAVPSPRIPMHLCQPRATLT